ncbi:hypothetical protein [Bradyrhizobium erythrophlei]|uniref:hypothetical protein n=1 Tax=Bradyrhizobium erythrophlei TaxID=1437360 RepID=UPI00115FC0DD|nr:hypothetical protein [Bradyrhizobium erythrophlei]
MAIMLDQMLFGLPCGHDLVLGRLEQAKTWKCEACKVSCDLTAEPEKSRLAKDLDLARQIDVQTKERGQSITRLG